MKSRKLMSILMASLIFTSSASAVYGQILHTQRIEQTVTKGVKLISEEVLTDVGWQDINLLKINLGSDNVKIAPIESSTLGERKTVLQMVNEGGAVAGVNADFFDMKAAYAPSFGTVIEDGELKHGYNYKYGTLGPAKHMATFMLDESNNVLIDYYGLTIGVVADDIELFDANTYNTMPGSLSRPIIVDGRYYNDNASLVNKYRGEGVYTILIQDKEATYLSLQDEVVAIPKGAKAIILSTKDAATYYPIIKASEVVRVEENISLNNQVIDAVENMQMGIGGGGLIMKNGQAYTGSAHKVDPNSRAPRTIVATTNTPEEVLLITIDGRNNTLGANHAELADILSKYGVKDAMYLDGGGSTTLVARNEGTSSITVQNSPSDKVERKVTNGIGVFSTTPKGSLSKLYIKANRDRTFIGEGITFNVTGTDENDNPLTVDPGSLKLSVTGVTGTWKGLAFYPESEGKGLVVAESGGVQVATEITVTNSPVGLYIEPSSMQIDENSTGKVQIYGVDKQGYKIPLTPEKVQWTSSAGSVSVTGNTVTTKGKDVALLTAKYNSAVGTVGITVGESVVAIDSFEAENGKWAGDTTTVKGKIEPSKDIKYHGNQSLKMTYAFDKDANKQVAYTVFNNPIVIPENSRSVNMWVHAKKQGDTMKLQVEDAAGKTHYLKLADSLNYEGWKYQSAWIPEEVKLPAKITKVYVYTNGNAAKRESAIYMDHLSVTRGLQKRTSIQVRDDYRYDPLYKPTLSAPTGNDYMINVAGPTNISSMKLSNQDVTSITNKLTSNASMVLLASKANVNTNFNKPTLVYNNGYQSQDYQDTKVLYLGTDSGGLRKTNASQWTQMKQSLEETSAKNIIMVMGKNPLTQFDDAREGKALHDYLKELRETTGKNIFVVYAGGIEKEVRLEDGIRYIRVNGLAVPSDNPKDGEYLKFKMHEGSIYYTFERMM